MLEGTAIMTKLHVQQDASAILDTVNELLFMCQKVRN